MILELDLPVKKPPRRRVHRLQTTWEVVRQVREMVDTALEDQPEPIRQSARLVASELMENLIKYGAPSPEGTQPGILVQIADGFLAISSRNNVLSEDDVHRAFEILGRLRAEDTQTVYIEAILRALSSKRQSPSMGLLRIAAEAGFEISATFEDGVLEIIAKKGVA